MNNIDRIAESYLGKLGSKMQEDSQKRIKWICDHVHGRTVIDIGCSQGICELLLAKQGCYVTGVDIEQESIDYANSMIADESEEIKKQIQFVCTDYLSDTNIVDKFETVILTEVLEHLVNPEVMLAKAMNNLTSDGEIIVTVPFGINDFPDHKHTFYMVDVLCMLSRFANIEKVEFMGGWIGFYAKRSVNLLNVDELDVELVKREEQAFFKLERPLRDRIIQLNELNRVLNEKYKKTENDYQTVKKWLNDKQAQNEAWQQKVQKQEKSIGKLNELLKKSYYELEKDTQALSAAKKQMLQLNAKLQMANAKNREYEEKLSKIYNTWYGRAALKIYKGLRKIKRFFRK